MWLLQSDLEVYIWLFPATSDQNNLYYINFWTFPLKQNQLYFHFQE